MADTAPTSLLIPPNPALQPGTPQGSILLNRNDSTCLSPKKQAAILYPTPTQKVANVLKSSFAVRDVPTPSTRQMGPPASMYNGRPRTQSTSSVVSDTSGSISVSSASAQKPSLKRTGSVSFAPLPDVPQLQRRRSIALGVAARSDLLKTQGGSAGRPGQPGAGVMIMTDEEWDEYKRNLAMRPGYSEEVPELHHIVMDGTKKLWKKARSLSSSSSASTSSSTSASGSKSGAYPDRGRSPTQTPQQDTNDRIIRVSSLDTGISQNAPLQPSSNLDRPGIQRTPSGGRTRLGLISRMKGQRLPESVILDDASDVTSDIGSILEVDEEGSISSGLGSEPIPEEMEVDEDEGEEARALAREEEEEEMKAIPAYLQQDLDVERLHYIHDHSGRSTPRAQRPAVSALTSSALSERLNNLQLAENSGAQSQELGRAI